LTGTWLNIATVIIGGTLGIFFGARLPSRVRQTIIAGLGLFTAAYGMYIFMGTSNPLVVLGSLLIGGLLGELLRIEDGLRNLGGFLEARFTLKPANTHNPIKSTENVKGEQTDGNRFIRGFLTASLVFCVGPMTILGSIQDGLTGDYSLLAIKSVLDGFASLAFASTLGIGVLFSALIILVYQGGISLLASQASAVLTPEMMSEMTAAGGVLLLGIAISNLLEIKPMRVGNFLPALAIAPIIVFILGLLKIGI
jgi:uncharacterized protein